MAALHVHKLACICTRYMPVRLCTQAMPAARQRPLGAYPRWVAAARVAGPASGLVEAAMRCTKVSGRAWGTDRLRLCVRVYMCVFCVRLQCERRPAPLCHGPRMRACEHMVASARAALSVFASARLPHVQCVCACAHVRRRRPTARPAGRKRGRWAGTAGAGRSTSAGALTELLGGGLTPPGAAFCAPPWMQQNVWVHMWVLL